MKTKHVLIGLAILTAGVVTYHYFAAYRAEQQIDEAIKEITANSKASPNLNYVEIDVDPFEGDILFEDLSIVDSTGLIRSQSVLLDLTYGDFLNIYFRGLKYGLEHLMQTRVTIEHPSYIDRSTLQEAKFDNLNVTVEGNAWNLIVSLVNSVPLRSPISILLDGGNFSFHVPNSYPGTIRADTIHSKHDFPAQNLISEHPGDHIMKANSIVWTPPPDFQKQYGFFVRGFGYDTSGIPADSLHLTLNSVPAHSNLLEISLFTDLFDAEINSELLFSEQNPSDFELKNGSVELHNASERFKNFLGNLEQLLGIKLSGSTGKILRFSGPLRNPRFTLAR